MVMLLTFLTMISFLILAAGSQKILRFYEKKPQVMAFFNDNTTNEDVKAIENALSATGKVSSVKYVSKEEALKRYQEANKDKPALLELVTSSMLPASLDINTYSPNDLNIIAEILAKEPVVEEVVFPKDVIESLTRATAIVRFVGGGAVGFLILFSFLIILMVIGFKIRLKRTEIHTMKLLGASSWFIKTPFILEGISYGVIGAILAWVVSMVLLWYFTPFVQNNIKEIPLLPISPLFALGLLLVAMVFAIVIGGLGSYGAVRRYLKL